MNYFLLYKVAFYQCFKRTRGSFLESSKMLLHYTRGETIRSLKLQYRFNSLTILPLWNKLAFVLSPICLSLALIYACPLLLNEKNRVGKNSSSTLFSSTIKMKSCTWTAMIWEEMNWHLRKDVNSWCSFLYFKMKRKHWKRIMAVFSCHFWG